MSLSDEDERALRFFERHAAYYAERGISVCFICGEPPERQPVFAELMSCGHPWRGTVYFHRANDRDQLRAHDNGMCVCGGCAQARRRLAQQGFRFSPAGENDGLVYVREPPEGHCRGPRCEVIDGPCRCACDRCAA